MKKIIPLLVAAFLIGVAFYKPKCDHVFTEVEQANIKIERPSLSGSIVYLMYSWPTGIQEGKELVCVKCFYKQRQVLDYGQPADTAAAFEIPDSWRHTTLTDTSIYGTVGTVLKKGDTLIWSTVKQSLMVE